MKLSTFSLFVAITHAWACNETSPTSNDSEESQPPQCSALDCGNDTFRHALPTTSSVQIRFGTAAARQGSGARVNTSGDSAAVNAEAMSPDYVAVEVHVASINDVIRAIFDDLEDVVDSMPEVATEMRHVWRKPDPDHVAITRVLAMERQSDLVYQLRYAFGPEGVEPSESNIVMDGRIQLDDQDAKVAFQFALDLDKLTAILPREKLQGRINIDSHPLPGGLREVFFDFERVAVGDDNPETSFTSYWRFDRDNSALEYVASVEDAEATVYARWGIHGGRYDHHVSYFHDSLGVVDEISTNCWNAFGCELFDAWAVIDENLSYYGELEGNDADCEFGPVADHPRPGPDFANLPSHGQWDELELLPIEGGGSSKCEIDDHCPLDCYCNEACYDEWTDEPC